MTETERRSEPSSMIGFYIDVGGCARVDLLGLELLLDSGGRVLDGLGSLRRDLLSVGLVVKGLFTSKRGQRRNGVNECTVLRVLSKGVLTMKRNR